MVLKKEKSGSVKEKGKKKTKLGYNRSDKAGFAKLEAKKDFHKILEKELGPRFREYRKKWEAGKECVTVQDFPLEINFAFTAKCNLRCRGCIHQISFGNKIKELYLPSPEKELSLETYKRIVDEGAKHDLYSVNLNGANEPLLRPDLPKAISYAREAGMVDVMFNTNALLLDEKKSIEVLDAEPTRIMFSLDAITAKTYNNFRIGSDFKTVMSNIERFLELKKERGQVLPITRVSFIVMKPNQHELEDFENYWADKIDFFSIQSFINPFVGTELEEQEAMEFSTEHYNESSDKCEMPFQRIMVNHDGSVSPCCSWYGLRNKVGNAYKESIYDIWNGKKISRVRKTVNGPWNQRPEACKNCQIALDMKAKP